MIKKIISYNVNGIRAALLKGLDSWLDATKADIFCLQEIKATPDQLDVSIFENLGYHCYWNPALKKGYSGTAIFAKQKPKNIEIGCGIAKYDEEGRVIRADFDDFSVMNVYMPSGSSGDDRQNFKFEWMDDFIIYAQKIAKIYPNLIIVGDYNICHQSIDIHNPKANEKTSGFLPEERAWMQQFFDSGFVDTFRMFNKEPHQYTWWSYRAGARGKNLGWRIDYQSCTIAMKDTLVRAAILPEAKHSDHCPTLLEIEI